MKKRIQFSGRLAVHALTLLMMSAMGMTTLAARGWVVENNEYGVANYDWYMDASGSTVSSYYYSTEEKCYLKTGWFKAVPDPDVDPEGWSNGDEYWYYADKKGQTAKSVIKNINGLRYGFDEFGKMLNGLYELEMADDGVTILDARYIETIDELPTDEGALV